MIARHSDFMNDDRYEYVANILKTFGWLQDMLLRNTRKDVVNILKSRNSTTTLDACCGAGTLSTYLCESGISVTGVDASPSMLAIAKKKNAKVNFIEADLITYSPDEPFESAVIAFSIHEMPEDIRVNVWQNIKRVVKEGHPIILVDFTSTNRNDIASRISRKCMEYDEKNIGRHDPGHFENYKEFMEQGGTKSWLLKHNEKIIEERYFMWCNIGVFVVNP